MRNGLNTYIAFANLVSDFWNDDRGQDMIEYTLLVAFIALASAAVYIGAGKEVRGIWSQANSDLVLANTAAS